jgi:protein-disulfide isomerase
LFLRRVLRSLPVLALALAIGGAAAAQQSTSPGMPPDQVEAIERIVRDYLLRHPEIIIEAVESLEKKRNDEARESAKTTIAERRTELQRDPDAPVAGNPNGDVTIVEFFDYRCPYCKQVVAPIAQLLKNDPNLRFVYKELPILGPESVVAARAALAARKQNKYHEMHRALMASRALTEDAILKIAADQGLDVARLKSDMAGAEIARILERNLQLARALGINGTPAFVIGEVVVPGAVDLPTLKSLVVDARKAK